MKTVMAFGTFDIFHPGHVNFLKQAKKYGDYLIVVVARDETVKEIKRHATSSKEQARLKKVKKSGLVGKAVLGSLGDKYAVIKKYKPDVICLGYDQKFFVDKLKEKIEKFGLKTKIIRLNPFRPEIYKSSKLKSNF